MKRGEIYWVKNHNHPCVLLNDVVDVYGRIDAIILTHDPIGGATLPNAPIPPDYFESFDENGNEYPFQWNYTQMVKCIFSKDPDLLIDKDHCVGKIKEEYLDKIKNSIVNKLTFDKPIKFLDSEIAEHPEMLIEIPSND